jgi:putative DNA primase/helicase
MCGGTDRFRFSNKDGRGTWVCRGCGPQDRNGGGDGFHLVMAFKGDITFAEAAKLIEGVVGSAQQNYRSDDWRKQSDAEKDAVGWLWKNEARPLDGFDLASQYLMGRGIETVPSPNAVRFAPQIFDRDHRANTRTCRAALLSRFVAHDDSCCAHHMTFLSPFGGKAEIERPKRFPLGAKVQMGGAVRLCDAAEEMGIATGTETSLSIPELLKRDYALFDGVPRGLPVWATLTDVALYKFEPPAICRRLHVFGDSDPSFSGQKVAYELAYRLMHRSNPVEIVVHLPPGWFDWNDALIELIDQTRAEEAPPDNVVKFGVTGG